MLKKNDAVARTIIYAGRYEKITEGGVTRHLYYLHGADGLAAVHVKQSGQTDATYYAHADHLGSIVKLTDANGAEVFKASYDAWGKQTITNSTFKLHRGYTGHEHLPEFGLVNMNGRMYDPLLGRMLSPDPYVQAPGFSQSYNRYSYCLNNPLKYTDSDGEWIHLVIGAAIGGVMNLMFNANNIDNFWQGLGYFGIGAAAGALGAGVGSGVSSVLAGGGFGAGFVGSSTAMVAVPSFASGAAIGGIAGTTSSFTLGMGNGLMQGQSIGEAYLSSFKMSLIGGGVGALLGGLAGGWQAWGQNRNFWTGELSSAVTWEDKMRLTYQRGLDNGGGGYDETTLGKNLLGTDYNGPNNVKGCVMQRTDVPIDYFGPTPNGTFVDYPALAHDIAYYRMGYEKGGIHLFFNPLTKAADARFVVQQLYLGTKNLWISPVLSLKSYALGIGLSAAATSTIWVPYTTYKIGRNNQWW